MPVSLTWLALEFLSSRQLWSKLPLKACWGGIIEECMQSHHRSKLGNSESLNCPHQQLLSSVSLQSHSSVLYSVTRNLLFKPPKLLNIHFLLCSLRNGNWIGGGSVLARVLSVIFIFFLFFSQNIGLCGAIFLGWQLWQLTKLIRKLKRRAV